VRKRLGKRPERTTLPETIQPVRSKPKEKGMRMPSIFTRNDREQVRVPEIEVRGDEIQVRNNDQAAEEQIQPGRSHRLPKTTWF
jgi:hypothetical protein